MNLSQRRAGGYLIAGVILIALGVASSLFFPSVIQPVIGSLTQRAFEQTVVYLFAQALYQAATPLGAVFVGVSILIRHGSK